MSAALGCLHVNATTLQLYTVQYVIIYVNNYIVSLYRFIIAVTRNVTRRTTKAKIIVM